MNLGKQVGKIQLFLWAKNAMGVRVREGVLLFLTKSEVNLFF